MAVINGTNGDDLGIFGGPALVGTGDDDQIFGLAGRDALSGLGGNDTLDGGTGDDLMEGNVGDDRYIVDNTKDSVTESSEEGIDTVESKVTFTLPNNVEILTLTGTANINATGKGLDDQLIGNSGNNALVDGSGNDTLKGNDGNDLLIGGIGDDTLDGGAKFDTIQERADANFVLSDTQLKGAGVDKLISIEAASLSGVNSGNSINAKNFSGTTTLTGLGGFDELTGGKNKDVLDGGSGNDILTGGAGADNFLYNTNSKFSASGVGVDTLKDFVHNTDTISLDKTTFNALTSVAGNGFSVASEFAVVGSDDAAATSTALITYNQGTGHLFYNQNGALAGFGDGAQFASLTNSPTLSAGDFLIQA